MLLVLAVMFSTLMIFIAGCNWMDTGHILGRSYTGRLYAKKKTPKQLTSKDIQDQLSLGSRKIYKMYKTLPADSQQGWDIVPILKALDVKHPEVNHFYSYTTGFDCDCEHKRRGFVKINAICTHKDYRILYDDIKATVKAADEREQALKVAGVQGDLDMLESFRASMASERKILSESTAQIKGMP